MTIFVIFWFPFSKQKSFLFFCESDKSASLKDISSFINDKPLIFDTANLSQVQNIYTFAVFLFKSNKYIECPEHCILLSFLS